jgi:hypothetical protein
MLRGRSDFDEISSELLKEALLARRGYRQKAQNIPQQNSPRAYALKQAALDLGVKKKNGTVYGFETLRKYYDGSLRTITRQKIKPTAQRKERTR